MIVDNVVAAPLLRRLRDLLDEAGRQDSDEVPPGNLVRGLAELVPGVFGTFCELDLAQRQVLTYQAADGVAADPVELDGYWRLRHQHPACHFLTTTGRTDVVQITDFITAKQFRDREIWTELYRPMGVEHIMCVPLPTAPGRTRVFLFGREAGSGFTEAERMMLTLLQPHLF
ncbi:MAG TPA: hypothetical protein VF163_13930, partial [Micromonosporaceae bacterium]